MVTVGYTYTHMQEMSKDQGLWNFIFGVVFLGLALLFFAWISRGSQYFQWLYLVDVFDLVVIALATFRLVRLVTFDKIFASVRHMFLVRQADGSYTKPDGGPRRTVAELMECLWCTGIWAALCATTLYFISDFGRFLTIILAVAAVGSFLQAYSRTMGHKH